MNHVRMSLNDHTQKNDQVHDIIFFVYIDTATKNSGKEALNMEIPETMTLLQLTRKVDNTNRHKLPQPPDIPIKPTEPGNGMVASKVSCNLIHKVLKSPHCFHMDLGVGQVTSLRPRGLRPRVRFLLNTEAWYTTHAGSTMLALKF